MFKKQLFTTLLILAAILFANSCKENSSAPTYTQKLVANLVDASNNPVIGAYIQALKGNSVISTDTTDEEGQFELANIPADLSGVTLLVKASGFPEMKTELNKLMKSDEFNSGKKFKILRQDSCKSSITLTVKDSASGKPLAYVWVKITKEDQIYAKIKTNSEGKIVVTNLCSGKYWYRIAPEGYKVVENYFILSDNDDQSIAVSVPKIIQQNCCSQLNLKIVDNDNGNPISEAEVKIVKSGSDWYNKKYTNSNGEVSFIELCDGKYWVRVSKDGYKVKEQDGFIFSECDTLDATVKLIKNTPPPDTCYGAFYITVKDNSNGKAISGAEVKITKEGWEGVRKNTDNNGKASIGQLYNGKYFVRIAKDGYQVMETYFYIHNCDTIVWEKKLVPTEKKDTCCNGQIVILPKDESSKTVINGAKIKLMKDGQVLKYFTISENQPAKFTEICEGKYIIVVIAEGYTTKQYEITLGCNKTIEEVIYLSKNQQQDTCCAGKIIVYPKDESNKTIINGAVVKLWKGGQLIKTITITDSQPAIFHDLCEGKYGISVTATGYKGKETDITLGCNKGVESVLYLTKNQQQDTCCNNKLIVYVKDDQSGLALKNAKVRIWKGGQQLTYKITDDNGKVVFEELCKGTYGVDIIREGYTSIEFQFEVNCNDTKEITKTMKANQPCNTAGLKFFVKDFDSGTPISGATVVIKANGQVVAEGTSDANGYYIKQGLTAPVLYSITISKDGYIAQTFDFNVKECKLYGETIKLKK